ncbi:hypothetical protein BDN72DRAFT_616548 [Pluteus cervinus]|uniref:Uncharacterized protein n=1 Tax=Pluteus cervinus TaxID=181527 RepID=A0ACD3AVH9_9AGAR|nr:hypothetical protein BDN72DRAFT_616548 [Pluteus cervinus]
MMVNLYNEISQIYWPRHWISIDSLPRVDSILEPTRQLMWVKYEERKQHESILDAEDSLATSLSGSFDQLLHIPNDAQPRPDSVDGRVRSSLRALISPHQWFTLLHRLLETLHSNDNAPMVM